MKGSGFEDEESGNETLTFSPTLLLPERKQKRINKKPNDSPIRILMMTVGSFHDWKGMIQGYKLIRNSGVSMRMRECYKCNKSNPIFPGLKTKSFVKTIFNLLFMHKQKTFWYKMNGNIPCMNCNKLPFYFSFIKGFYFLTFFEEKIFHASIIEYHSI